MSLPSEILTLAPFHSTFFLSSIIYIISFKILPFFLSFNFRDKY